MICPQCEEGTIRKIIIKSSQKINYLCEYCGMMWVPGEQIDFNTGHPIQSFTQGQDTEFVFGDVKEKDEDLKPVYYPKYKL